MQWHNHHRYGGETKLFHPPFFPLPDYQPPLLLFFPSYHEMAESERSVASMREALGGERRKEERERERRKSSLPGRAEEKKKKTTGQKKTPKCASPPLFALIKDALSPPPPPFVLSRKLLIKNGCFPSPVVARGRGGMGGSFFLSFACMGFRHDTPSPLLLPLSSLPYISFFFLQAGRSSSLKKRGERERETPCSLFLQTE